jgi:hypothetical protein
MTTEPTPLEAVPDLFADVPKDVPRGLNPDEPLDAGHDA